MEALKKFALNSSTSSLTERQQLFQDLFAVLSSDAKNGKNLIKKLNECFCFLNNHRSKKYLKEIPEAAYKGLGKIAYYLFPVYTTKESKENLIKLNDYLIMLNVENSFKPLLSSLESHSKLCAVNNPR